VIAFVRLESRHYITWVPYTCCNVHFRKKMCVQMVRRSRKEAVGSEELERAKCRSKYKQNEMGQCSSSKNIKRSSLIRQRKLLLLNVFYELLLNMQIVNVAKLCVEERQP